MRTERLNAFTGLSGIAFVTIGAWLAWGWPVALFVLGVIAIVDAWQTDWRIGEKIE